MEREPPAGEKGKETGGSRSPPPRAAQSLVTVAVEEAEAQGGAQAAQGQTTAAALALQVPTGLSPVGPGYEHGQVQSLYHQEARVSFLLVF